MMVSGQLPGSWAERPEFSQIHKMQSVPLKDQLATFMDSPEVWVPLRNQLLILFQLGYRLAEFVHMNLDRTVVLTCIGDVLPEELELLPEGEVKAETASSYESPSRELSVSAPSTIAAAGTTATVHHTSPLSPGVSPDYTNTALTEETVQRVLRAAPDDAANRGSTEPPPATGVFITSNHTGLKTRLQSPTLMNGACSTQSAATLSPTSETDFVRDLNGSGRGSQLAVNLDLMEMISDDEDDGSEAGSLFREPSPAILTKRVEFCMTGRAENESVSASDTAVHLEEDDSASDMEIENEDFTSIVDGVWGTLKAGNHSRVRPSAADLNVGFPSYGSNFNPQRALFKEQPQNLVIHLSDSESDESDDDGNIPVTALPPPPLPKLSHSDSVKERMNLLEKQKKELQEKMKLLEARRKKTAPAGQISSTAKQGAIKTPSVQVSKAPSTEPVSRMSAVIPSALSKPALVAQPPVEERTSKQGAAKDAAESVLAMMSAARNLHKSKLESEIAVEETVLAATQAEVARNEVSINNVANELRTVREKREELAQGIARRKEQIAALNRQVEEDEQETVKLLKAEAEIANRLSVLKKQALSKGSSIPDLHRGINAKRAEILKLSVESDSDKGSKPCIVKSLGKRFCSDGEQSSAKRPKTIKVSDAAAFVAPTEYDEGFVHFLQDVLAVVGNVPTAAESSVSAKLPILTEASKEEASLRILEPARDTLEPLMNIGGHLRTEKDIALMSDVHMTKSLSSIDWWNPVRKGGDGALGPKVTGEEGKKKALVPYSSHLSRFRSFRFSKTYDKDIKSLTWSNKIDPFVNLCRFETEGGVCHDASCKGQHFRDISMTEKELAVDLISYTATDAGTGVDANLARLKDDLQAVGHQGSRLDHLARAVAHHQKSENADDIASLSFGRQSGALPRRVSASDMTVLVETSAPAPPKRTPALPPAEPILVNGLRALIDKEKPKHARYYKSGVLSEDDLQAAALANPKNVSAWVEYAVSVLPANLALNDLAPGTPLLNKPLNVLSRALQENRDAEELWAFYMELYGRVGTRSDARETFEQAVRFVKGGWTMWWRWCSWEKEVAAKIDIMHKMVAAILAGSYESKQAILLDASLHLTKLYIDDGRLEDGKAWLRAFLTATSSSMLTKLPTTSNASLSQSLPTVTVSDTVASAFLESEDLSLAWILFFHLEHFGSLPHQVFHTYPYAYLVRRQMWEIKWMQWVAPMNDEAYVTLTVAAFRRVLKTWNHHGGRQSAHAYIALERNMSSFLKTSLALPIGSSAQTALHANMAIASDVPGVWELPYMQNKTAESLSAVRSQLRSDARRYALWNLYVKLAICIDQWEEALLALVNCARSLFADLDPLIDWNGTDKGESVDDALILYRKALALHVESLRTPDLHPDLSRGDLRSNVFLWLNYLMLSSIRVVGSPYESNQDLMGALDHATEVVRNPDERKLLWIEYLRFELKLPSKDAVATHTYTARDALVVVTRAVKDVKIDSYGHPGLRGLEEAATIDFTKPVPLRDLIFAQRLFSVLSEHFPRAELFEIVDLAAEGQLPLGAIPA
ncbi:Zinc finger C3H1 domain-containing protein [Geranomyces michiganensis]|nr:Zinc finger C3H1 domain-containing protein [Geranomyces michiganensis]